MTIAKVTDKEFLIAFSYADRDRAKLIRNYRWDPVEKVWRYPLSKRSYQELLREFDPDELEFTGDVSRLAEWNRTAQEDSELDAILASFPSSDTDADEDPEDYRFVCSLAQMVRDHGGVANSYSEIFRFLQGCVSERASEAGTDARLAIQNAELAATRVELARLRLEQKSGSDNFETVLVDAAWGDANIPRPEFLTSFRFDSDGVIKATEWVARSLRATLHKAPGAVSLYELAKEAADAQIISKDVHRLCETLRHQRNKFGHDGVGPGETMQHALLALTAFSLIYREVYPKLPSSPPTK
ncbi:MAG: hypothetical protein IPG77_08715 [Betaproteobacteria bacterium]|nr:hypothetical protein [Betaproteobacteria bacterium]